MLKQGQYAPIPVEDQVMAIFAVTHGYLDDLEASEIRSWEESFREYMRSAHPEVGAAIGREGDQRRDGPETPRRDRGPQEPVPHGGADEPPRRPPAEAGATHANDRGERINGEGQRYRAADAIRRKHAQDHAHHGDGRDVEAAPCSGCACRQARPFADRLTAVVENLITPELADLEPVLRQPDRIRRPRGRRSSSRATGGCAGRSMSI